MDKEKGGVGANQYRLSANIVFGGNSTDADVGRTHRVVLVNPNAIMNRFGLLSQRVSWPSMVMRPWT